jgi:hypothetical protein
MLVFLHAYATAPNTNAAEINSKRDMANNCNTRKDRR